MGSDFGEEEPAASSVHGTDYPPKPLCDELKDRKRLRGQPETPRGTFTEVRQNIFSFVEF